MPSSTIELYLASTSPRRHELLKQAGVRFESCTPGAEYEAGRDEHGAEVGDPLALAQQRAQRKACGAQPPQTTVPVLGVDTVVDVEGHELGKPRDRGDAERMLRSLVDRQHLVHTAHCLWLPSTGRTLAATATAVVACRLPTADEIEHYLDSNEWGGKAGGYGIQDRAQSFFRLVRGSLDTVVGLHLASVQQLLARLRQAT